MKSKRLLSFVMALVLCCSLLPFGALAAEEDTAEPEAEVIIPEEESEESSEVPAETEEITEEAAEAEESAEEATEPEAVIIEAESEESTEAVEEAEDGVTASGTCGGYGNEDNVTWQLNASGVLTISGTGCMDAYSDIQNYVGSVKKVVVKAGITAIPRSCFENFTALTSVTLPATVTEIENVAFFGCTNLKSVTLSSGLETIGQKAFYGCASLTGITIPDSVKTIEYGAFINCVSLTSIDIPNNVTELGSEAFAGCTALASVTLGSGLTSIGYQTFYRCASLKSIQIPSTVTCIGPRAFSGCSALAAVSFPSTLKEIEYCAFQDCDSLKSITIPASVESIDVDVFDDSDNLASITVNKANQYYASQNGILYNKEKTTLLFCPRGKQGNVSLPSTVTTIEERAFEFCFGITGITLPTGLQEIGKFAFNGTAITSITVPEGVTTIYGGTFQNCKKLTEVSLPSTVTSILGSAFRYCSSLTSFAFPNSMAIQACTFYACNNLTSIYIPNAVTEIGKNAFFNCYNLKNIYFGGTKAQWEAMDIDGTGNTDLYNAAITCSCGQPVRLTIDYNHNNTCESQIFPVGVSFALPTPTRTGYTFQGWATSSGGSVAYKGGASYTVKKATTLYAVWKAKTYTVKYYANGGSGAPASGTKTYGKSFTISSTKPTRYGYTFQGWATSKTATTAKYLPGTAYTALDSFSLYAVWKANTYTVKYYANGGSGAPSSGTKTYGKSFTISSTKPTRTGYQFLGWATSKTATTAKYLPGKSYTSLSSFSLYAVWAKKNTVTYNANGGTGAPSSGIKVTGQSYTIPTTKPTRTGYTFLGWATSKTATTAKYLPGKTYSTLSSFTLYAVWQKK